MRLIPYAIMRFFSSVTALGSPVLYLLALLYLALYNWQFALLLAIPLLALETVCASIKMLWHRPRPKPRRNEGTWLDRYHAGSFPSSHSARVMLIGIMMLHFFSGWLLSILTALVVLAVGYSRIYRKRHYVSDVIGGYGIGAVIGVVTLTFLL